MTCTPAVARRTPQPWQDEAHAAAHGGLWRIAYAPAACSPSRRRWATAQPVTASSRTKRTASRSCSSSAHWSRLGRRLHHVGHAGDALGDRQGERRQPPRSASAPSGADEQQRARVTGVAWRRSSPINWFNADLLARCRSRPCRRWSHSPSSGHHRDRAVWDDEGPAGTSTTRIRGRSAHGHHQAPTKVSVDTSAMDSSPGPLHVTRRRRTAGRVRRPGQKFPARATGS